jgi:hypothetical protein
LKKVRWTFPAERASHGRLIADPARSQPDTTVFFFQFYNVMKQGFDVYQKQAPIFRQLHAPAYLGKKLYTAFFLQQLELLRDRGLTDIDLARRLGHIQVPRDGGEYFKLA